MEIKVCIIGDSGVGKTCISMRYCHGSIPEAPTPTIGASFVQRRLLVGDVEASLQIWDTAGQERFRSMAPMYYRGSKAAILVFDVSSKDSFDSLKRWLKELNQHADPELIVCIAANKCDLVPAFDLMECEEYAYSVGAKFFKTSAVSGENINEMFESLIQTIVGLYTSRDRSISQDASLLNLGAKPHGNQGTNTTGGRCC
jgi:Ras-related protein Rab-22